MTEKKISDTELNHTVEGKRLAMISCVTSPCSNKYKYLFKSKKKSLKKLETNVERMEVGQTHCNILNSFFFLDMNEDSP